MSLQKPFKIRCPHKGCQKYMLIEASAIKGKIQCLVCKKEFQVNTSKSKKKLPDQKKKTKSKPVDKGLSMIFCPRCESSFGLPPDASSELKKKCPKCGQSL